MVNRFKDTHEIEVISDDNRKISDNIKVKKIDKKIIIDEGRPKGMKWVKMIRK